MEAPRARRRAPPRRARRRGARLLSALDEKARPRKLRIQRILLAPEYVPLLLASPAGRKLGPLSGAILRSQVWWRHDEHAHIDFATGALR